MITKIHNYLWKKLSKRRERTKSYRMSSIVHFILFLKTNSLQTTFSWEKHNAAQSQLAVKASLEAKKY